MTAVWIVLGCWPAVSLTIGAVWGLSCYIAQTRNGRW